MTEISNVLTTINRRYKRQIVQKLSDIPPLSTLSTGIPGIDYILGGGWGVGRIGLIVGREGSAKTSVAIRTTREALTLGWNCYYIDVERAVDVDWMYRLGVNPDSPNLAIVQGDERGLVGEDVFRVVREILRAIHEPSLIIIDSVAAIAAGDDYEDSTTVAPGARLVNRAVRVWSTILPRHSVLLLINQFREGPNNTGILPNGVGQLYAAAQRIDMRRGSWLQDSKTVYGIEVKSRAMKNKIAPPYRTAVMELRFWDDPVFNEVLSLVTTATITGIIKPRGSWYDIGDEKLNGMKAVEEYLTTDSDAFYSLRNEVYQKLGTTLTSDMTIAEVANGNSPVEGKEV